MTTKVFYFFVSTTEFIDKICLKTQYKFCCLNIYNKMLCHKTFKTAYPEHLECIVHHNNPKFILIWR